MYTVKDKVFLVTGGAHGIGEGSVRAFLDEDAKHVSILDLDATKGIALDKELADKYGSHKIKFYKCDITTDQLIEVYDEILSKQGYIDVVLNCAGILNDHPNVWEKAIAVNLTALIKSSFKAYSFMRKDKGGRGGTIINISSIAALFLGPFLPVYNATKSGVLMFSNNLGSEPNYSNSGVRVVTLCFGCTDTALLREANADAFDESIRQTWFDVMDTMPFQTTENAVRGLLDAYKKGASASTWLVIGNKDAQDISSNITEAYDILGRGV